MENTLIECACGPTASCDTSTNSPHEVAFAPSAAKASNCQYFAVSTRPICSSRNVVLLLKNPTNSKTILYVDTESVSNYGDEAIAAYLAENVSLSSVESHSVPIHQTNLGCTSKSAAEVCWAGHTHTTGLCSGEFLTQDIVPPLSTLHLDLQGGFVVTPGKTLAVVVKSLCPRESEDADIPGCIHVGIDLRWWETPCNSHT